MRLTTKVTIRQSNEFPDLFRLLLVEVLHQGEIFKNEEEGVSIYLSSLFSFPA
jgi:hypothetical protein